MLRLRGWCWMDKTAVNTHLLQVRTLWWFRRPQTYFETGTFRLLPSPRGVHPIGGRNGDPMEAQRSGFHWERTSDGMSEPCPLGPGEGYEVREDEVGRFKGIGYLGEGGNRNPSPLRRLFGNFLSAQKVTRPQAKPLPHFPPTSPSSCPC